MASLDSGLEIFTNWQTVALGLTIYVMTAAIRRVIETGRPSITHSKWWREVFLPLGPVGNGIILALVARAFPWPEPVAGNLSARVMYALVCGLGCGWLYGRFRGFFKQGGGTSAASDIVPLDSPTPELTTDASVPSTDTAAPVEPTPVPAATVAEEGKAQ